MQKIVDHGANIYELSEELGIDKGEIYDFSSNINPFGASTKAKNAVIKNIDEVSVYPDPSYGELKRSISEYSGVEEGKIILGSGATELISAYIKCIFPKRALILSPAYSEYEKELIKIGCQIDEFYYRKEDNFKIDMKLLTEKIKGGKYDLVVICNPNNPTGFCFTKEEIAKIAETGAEIMVDETYIEFTEMEKYSCASLVDNFENLFVIRGTSKFFSTPGIRLGYAFLNINGKHYGTLCSSGNLWNINIFASIMGEVMFRDSGYIKECREKIATEKKLLWDGLSEIEEIEVYNTASNFILCRIKKQEVTASKLRNEMMKKGMIIRDASKFKGLDESFFRVCILKNNENMALLNEMKNFFKKL